MRCRVCGSGLSASIFTGTVIGYEVNYYDCSYCGYVQTEEPSWLDEAYSSPINATDTGIMTRNQANVHLVLATLHALNRQSGTVVDYAGGYGFLVRMLRDVGVNALWHDPYSDNLVARGFEHNREPADLVTAFELFEHFVNPSTDLTDLFSISSNVLFTTMLVSDPAPHPLEWWYYGLEHGQHVGFFRLRTLHYLAGLHGKRVISDGAGTHLFTETNVSRQSLMIRRKLSQLAPFLFTRGLQSKTWSDHEQLASRYQEDNA